MCVSVCACSCSRWWALYFDILKPNICIVLSDFRFLVAVTLYLPLNILIVFSTYYWHVSHKKLKERVIEKFWFKNKATHQIILAGYTLFSVIILQSQYCKSIWGMKILDPQNKMLFHTTSNCWTLTPRLHTPWPSLLSHNVPPSTLDT